MIEIDGLTKYYDTTCAVDNISFTINGGEILGLLGPNGAGKTTTMRILTCYMRPSSGTIRVKDFDITEDPIEVKRLIGYLPESAPLYPDMLTYDYLAYIAAVRGIRGDDMVRRIDELNELCGLQEIMHKSIKEVSRGYKQRVGLAHAMMSDPEILVLDEPTAGLDPNQIVQIRSIIKEMGKQKTVIFSTHILSEAEATCDRVVIVNKGKVVADDTPETLGARGMQSQIIGLTLLGADATQASQVLAAVEGVKEVAVKDSVPTGQVGLNLLCEGDRRSEVYQAVKATDWVLLELAEARQSLEDTFRELTHSETGQEG